MYAKKVRTNVKGIGEADLGPCTLLVGPNRSGKSAVIDSAAIALCGEAASDGLGKLEVRLMALKPEGDAELFSEVELSDGSQVTWSAKGTTAKASRATWQTTAEGGKLPAGVLIADEAAALIAADPKRLRPALLGQLDVALTQDVLRARTPASLWPRLETLLGPAKEYGEQSWYETDHLMRALAGSSEQLKGARRALRTIKAELDGSVAALTDSEEAELRDLLAAASSATMTAEEIEGLRNLVGRLESDLAAVNDEIMRTATTEEVDSRQYQLVDTVRKTQVVLTGYVKAAGKDVVRCPCCGSEDVPVLALEQRAAEFERLLAGMDSARKFALRGEELRRRAKELNAQRDDAAAKVATAVTGEGVDRVRLRELQERKARAERAASLGDERLKVEAKVNELKTLSKLCQEVVAEYLDAETAKLTERINLALPPDIECTIQLRDGDREVCRVALDGRDVRALSGAERAALVAAFTSAVVRDDHPPVRLLVVDDVWLDPTMIASVLEGVRTIVNADGIGPTQAIVALVEYNGPDPDGWTVVRL